MTAINYAFDTYMKHGADDHGRFFRPAPAQIVRLCGEWVDRQSGPKSGEAIATIDAWKADPEARLGMADVAAEFKKLMQEKGIL